MRSAERATRSMLHFLETTKGGLLSYLAYKWKYVRRCQCWSDPTSTAAILSTTKRKAIHSSASRTGQAFLRKIESAYSGFCAYGSGVGCAVRTRQPLSVRTAHPTPPHQRKGETHKLIPTLLLKALVSTQLRAKCKSDRSSPSPTLSKRIDFVGWVERSATHQLHCIAPD